MTRTVGRVDDHTGDTLAYLGAGTFLRPPHTGTVDCWCTGACMPNPLLSGGPPARGRASASAQPAQAASELSLKRLRRDGYTCAPVEKWNPFALRPDGGLGIRQDLFGFADIFAFRHRPHYVPASDFLFVQATTRGLIREHVVKLRANDVLPRWLATGIGRCEVWGWHRAAKKWKLTRVELVLRGGRVRTRIP